MSQSDKEGIMLLWGLSILLVITLMANYGVVKDSEIYKAQAICKEANSSLKNIHIDGDFECWNGAFYDSGDFSKK